LALSYFVKASANIEKLGKHPKKSFYFRTRQALNKKSASETNRMRFFHSAISKNLSYSSKQPDS